MNLPAIRTATRKFTLCQFDQAPQLAELLGLDLELDSNRTQLKKLLEASSHVLSPFVSGVILDPSHSFFLADQQLGDAGLVFRLTPSHLGSDPLAVPQLLPDWGVAEIANNYGSAKLELHYHPAEEKALEKKQLLAELYDYCQYQGIALLVKLEIFNPYQQEYDPGQFQQDQLQAVQELRNFADLLALQYPLEPLPTATLTAELDIPWVLSMQQSNYNQFERNLEVCLENGAQGFLLDYHFWQELEQYRREDGSPDWDRINQFVETQLHDRIIKLARFTNQA